MELVDGYGNIIVPPAVRPIIDPKEPPFGSKKIANKQYSCGSLHIRDYSTHYTVHMDIVDPLSSPLGHLLMDVPEYLAGATATFIVGRHLSAKAYNICKKGGQEHKGRCHRRGYGWTHCQLYNRQPCFQDGQQLAGKEKE